MAIDDVSVTIAVGDTKLKTAGFGVPLILPEDVHTVFGDRTKEYADLTEVLADFATTTKTHKAASALFAQTTKNGKAIDKIKVGRIDAGDSDLTASLIAISNEDNDWYALLYEGKVKANILLAAAYIETVIKIFITSIEDADILTSVTTDLMSLLQALNYNRTGVLWNHQGGTDIQGLQLLLPL